MTVIDGMKITEDLVGSLRQLCRGAGETTRIEDFINSLMVANDYLIDKLTESETTNVSEITKLSLMLVDMKAIRDGLSGLNNHLKYCIDEKN